MVRLTAAVVVALLTLAWTHGSPPSAPSLPLVGLDFGSPYPPGQSGTGGFFTLPWQANIYFTEPGGYVTSGCTPGPTCYRGITQEFDTAYGLSYQLMQYFDGHACTVSQGYNDSGTPDGGATWAALQLDLSNMWQHHVQWAIIDEIQPKPGELDASSSTSIAWNVTGCNIIASWMHTNTPGLRFGISMGTEGGNSTALHLSMFNAGLIEDTAITETQPNGSSGFGTLNTAMPNTAAGADWSAGATTISVGACPTVNGTFGVNPGQMVFDETKWKIMGYAASCSSGTLTLQSGSAYAGLSGDTIEFVQTGILSFNTSEFLCGTNTGTTGGSAVAVPLTGAGSVDIRFAFDADMAGGGPNGLVWGPISIPYSVQNMITFSQSGYNPICQLPYSELATTTQSPGTVVAQWNTLSTTTWSTANVTYYIAPNDFQLWTNTALNPNVGGSGAIASCEYMVKAGTGAWRGPNDSSLTTTVNWTTRTCNSALAITVGATGNCNVKGDGSAPGGWNGACQIWVRAKTVGGAYGNVTYETWAVGGSG